MNSAIHIRQVTNLKNRANLLKLDSGHYVKVSEYSQTSLTLEIENSYAGKGQLVSFIGEILINKERMNFECVAEIADLQVIEGSLVRFEFRLVEIDQTLWKNFLDSKKKAQNHIDDLLQKMRGDSSHA